MMRRLGFSKRLTSTIIVILLVVLGGTAIALSASTAADAKSESMITGIHHTAISTGDIERSLRFYRDLLGFEVVSDSRWPVGIQVADEITGLKDSSARMIMLRIGEGDLEDRIELFQFSSPKPKPSDPNRPVCDHGYTHICVGVTNVDAEYERLKAGGMKFHCPPKRMGGNSKVTYGRDPDGNVIELLGPGSPE